MWMAEVDVELEFWKKVSIQDEARHIALHQYHNYVKELAVGRYPSPKTVMQKTASAQGDMSVLDEDSRRWQQLYNSPKKWLKTCSENCRSTASKRYRDAAMWEGTHPDVAALSDLFRRTQVVVYSRSFVETSVSGYIFGEFVPARDLRKRGDCGSCHLTWKNLTTLSKARAENIASKEKECLESDTLPTDFLQGEECM
ncbi:hypothetical protein Aduo_008454 [Ancylostoma duodenale]